MGMEQARICHARRDVSELQESLAYGPEHEVDPRRQSHAEAEAASGQPQTLWDQPVHLVWPLVAS